jgi:putative RNA 2'-phosphotransferase
VTDPVRLSKTLAFLLRHRPDVGGLRPDGSGWFDVEAVAAGLARVAKVEITTDEVRALASGSGPKRFELDGDRIRATREGEGPRRPRNDEQRSVQPPDILYHATTEQQIQRIRTEGALLAPNGRNVFLSAEETHAWRVAHRLSGDSPTVLYIDAARARRHGTRFFRNKKNGLFMADRVPLSDVLNLQEGFAEQISAGGIPILQGPNGPEMALIRVTRKSGVTWEVAKGKLEHGEPPEIAAVREVREEMGVTVDLDITLYLGAVRYGFLAPGGLPRLKTVHLFLMQPTAPIESFTPASGEGVAAVRWFPLAEAAKAVTHSSLVPLIRRACAILDGTEESKPGTS